MPSPRTLVRLVSCSGFLCVGLVSCLGTDVTLGQSPPDTHLPGDGSAGAGGDASTGGPWLEVFDVRPVASLNSEAQDDNITLTADLLQACLTSERPGGTGDVDVWCARRSVATEPFESPIEVAIVNSPEFESSSAISLDGLSLWFGSARDGGQGGLDIWRSDRADDAASWSEPVLETVLNSTEDDIPRQPSGALQVMPLASRRTDDIYWTYLAERDPATGTFTTPDLVTELARSGRVAVDAFLSSDGLRLLFTSDGATNDDPSDLYQSSRKSVDEPFSEAQPLFGANSSFDDRDPWLSPAGDLLYFASDRDGDFDIYVADVRLR